MGAPLACRSIAARSSTDSLETANQLTSGCALGGGHFVGAGALSLDESFSPIQLLADLEIRDHVPRVRRGLDTSCAVESCLQGIRDGLERGFVGIESTLRNYRDLYWRPRLFERRFLGPWQAAGSPTFEQDA